MPLIGSPWVFSHLPGTVPVLLESECHQSTVVAAAYIPHLTAISYIYLVALLLGFAADVRRIHLPKVDLERSFFLCRPHIALVQVVFHSLNTDTCLPIRCQLRQLFFD